jgi:protein-L-isoaspartate(D-aspartate) O-methyltransferase
MDFVTERDGLVAGLSREIRDKRVLSVMSRIPREIFVPEDVIHLAYLDEPLPIGHGQTISQPYMVALMTQALELIGNEKVLEIGTGSGYQAAVLAGLCHQVVTTERIPALAESAGKALSALGFDNITVHIAGDELGWAQDAPYDAIVVTAGSPSIPSDLVSQLAWGGRLVIPVGLLYAQELCRLIRDKHQNQVEHLVNCRFVPLIGKGAWNGSES